MIKTGSKVKMKTNDLHEMNPDFYPDISIVGIVLSIDDDSYYNFYVDWGKNSGVMSHPRLLGGDTGDYAWFCNEDEIVEVENEKILGTCYLCGKDAGSVCFICNDCALQYKF